MNKPIYINNQAILRILTMKLNLKVFFLNELLIGFLVVLVSTHAQATGMQPETTVVILNESDGEASINIKNTDPNAALLYSSIESIPEDTETLVVLTPPVARVEAGETQLVRIIKQSSRPIKVQRLKRVIFEGIKQNNLDPSSAKIGVTVRQNLPLIIHPAGLLRNHEPWKLLKWSVQANQLMVTNDSPYVVRLAQMVKVLPSGINIDLGRVYILPGETITPSAKVKTSSTRTVRISPATVYGFSVDQYDAALQ